MKIPNTFIVGAPKSGTTAMCEYLKQHPSAYVCEPKEPHYFARKDMPDREQYYRDEQRYIELFSTAIEGERVLVDGSVWYLYCEQAVELIAKFNPEAKIIIMLRRPDEMIYSFHSQALETYDEDVADFSSAWRMAVGGVEREQLPKYCQAPSVLAYDQICCYSEQVARVYKHFPLEQVHIIFFEDFKKDTRGVYEELLEFLGLESLDTVAFDRVNPNSSVRNRFFGQFVYHPPESLLRILKVLKKVTGVEKIGLRDKLLALNRRVVPRERLDEDIRLEILNCYHNDIKQLQTLTGRDLSSWMF